MVRYFFIGFDLLFHTRENLCRVKLPKVTKTQGNLGEASLYSVWQGTVTFVLWGHLYPRATCLFSPVLKIFVRYYLFFLDFLREKNLSGFWDFWDFSKLFSLDFSQSYYCYY